MNGKFKSVNTKLTNSKILFNKLDNQLEHILMSLYIKFDEFTSNKKQCTFKKKELKTLYQRLRQLVYGIVYF